MSEIREISEEIKNIFEEVYKSLSKPINLALFSSQDLIKIRIEQAETEINKLLEEKDKQIEELKKIINKLDVEILAPIVYESLEKFPNHFLNEHEDRQDVGWTVAVDIVERFLKNA